MHRLMLASVVALILAVGFISILSAGQTWSLVDLNGDGAGDVFRYKPASGEWSMDISDLAGRFTSPRTGTWSPNWKVYPADFNADGLTDFLLYNPTSGVAYELVNTGSGFTYSRADWSPGWDITVVDLNGDGRSDLFLYNPINGVWFRAVNVGLGVDQFSYTTGNPWSDGFTISSGDFNGDGRADLFLYHNGAGAWWEVLTTPGLGFTYYGGIMSEGWVPTIADFNGDGRSDVLLYRPTDGLWIEAITTGPGTFDWSRHGTWDAGFTVAAGDFNGDGRSDLFLYHPTVGAWWQALTAADGTLTTWNGTSMSEGWTVQVTDLNADRRSDVVLYRPTDGTWFTAISVGPGTFNWTSGNWGTGWTVIASTPPFGSLALTAPGQNAVPGLTVGFQGSSSCTPAPGMPCTLNVVAWASDPDGDPLRYAWSGCATGTSPQVTCAVERPGPVVASVQVSDGHGHTVGGTVSGEGTNHPPGVQIGYITVSTDSIELLGNVTDPDEGTICGRQYCISATGSGACGSARLECTCLAGLEAYVTRTAPSGMCTVVFSLKDSWGQLGTPTITFDVSNPQVRTLSGRARRPLAPSRPGGAR